MNLNIKIVVCSAALLLSASPANLIATETQLTFACQADNDLYRTLVAAGVKCVRFDAPDSAIDAAAPGSAVLVLADQYPKTTTAVKPAAFAKTAQKKLRLFVEYPNALPNMSVAAPRATSLERVVVATDDFGDSLKKLQVVAIHNCHFVPTHGERPYLVLAKVAGFDRAVYGLAGTPTFPILFEHPGGSILVSTTKLSNFITARYAPIGSIQAIWRMILAWLQPGAAAIQLDWTPLVEPTFAKDAEIPADAARLAIQRGIDWHVKAQMFATEKEWQALRQKFPLLKTPGDFKSVSEEPRSTADGRYGVYEGICSRIGFNGNQPRCLNLRSDCVGESALPFALHWKLTGNVHSRDVACNLLDWVYFNSGLFEDDAAKNNGGILCWMPQQMNSLYQDNDIKAILGCIGAAGMLKTDRWDEVVVKNILGNFRTTGINGFRGEHCLQKDKLLASGWQKYWQRKAINCHPHYEAWMWAAYLWLYDKTHFEPLLARTRLAIRTTMNAYPSGWRWTNGFQQERGRMLLPLAWLVRVDDRPEHRRWLKQVASDIERCQDGSGAIREELGDPGKGQYGPPKSNAEYGQNESPLTHANGDPAADLLYTCNFAFVGLHEAFAATGDQQYQRMADRLARFLLQVQVKSRTRPELDGGWFRAFDFKNWEYWGSNADHAWGAWMIEVGWTQGWIPSVLMMRELKTSLWDLSQDSTAAKKFNAIRLEMLPDNLITPPAKKQLAK